jgi:hypothetical protein
MAESNVTLDHQGIAEVLKSAEVHALMNDAAHQIADAAREIVNGASPVPVHEYTTDRGAASVSIHAKYQVTDGVLTRAAASVGLHVRDR